MILFILAKALPKKLLIDQIQEISDSIANWQGRITDQSEYYFL
jgi:hypothetical protein